jgi:hypothetical protein
MSAVFTVDFINEQITALKALLAANTQARIAAQGTQSYTLETGQTRQSVMKAQLASLADERAKLLSELSDWERLLCGGGAVRGVPGW